MLGWYRSPLEVAASTSWKNFLATRNAAQPKVRFSAEGAKNIANIVGRLDSSLVSRIPVGKNALDNLDASIVDVVDGNAEAILVYQPKVLKCRHARWLSVKIGS